MNGLTLEKLSKSFGSKKALDGISAHIPYGNYALLGPNGAGKTTLLRILATVIPQSEGSIRFSKLDWKDPKNIRPWIGYLPQDFSFYQYLTVQEALEYIAILKKTPIPARKQEIERLLIETNIEDVKNKRIKELSGGTKRRLGVAQALLGSPKILLFDEPTAGLDPEERIRLRNLFIRFPKDRFVLVSTHIAQDAEAMCSHVIIISQGRFLTIASVDELKQQAQGYVCEKIIRLEEYEKLAKSNTVISFAYEENNLIKARFLLREEAEQTHCVQPTLEDAYMKIVTDGSML